MPDKCSNFRKKASILLVFNPFITIKTGIPKENPNLQGLKD